jgi:poly-beta-1,6-N-acetyl-D-glucosamine biosynthesis protein PgaD
MPDDAFIVSLNPIGRRHRTRDAVLTMIMWGVYIYLWIPLITLGAWLVGFERFYEVLIVYGGVNMLMDMLDWYAVVIITIATIIVTWSGINYRRFHGKERRRSAGHTTAHDISEFFGIPEKEVNRLRMSRRLQIDLDELGHIANITHYGYVDRNDQEDTVKIQAPFQ